MCVCVDRDGGVWFVLAQRGAQRGAGKGGDIISWAPKAGGRGDASPAVEKSAGDVPQKLGYFSNFFLDTYTILHFPIFSK